MKANAHPHNAGNKPIPAGVTLPASLPGLPALPLDDRDDCLWASENLTAYLDDAMNSVEVRRFESHLDVCSGCTEELENLVQNDTMIQREWRQEAPLPSSSHRRQAIDAIMDSLPPTPETPTDFATRRIHARARWMRFSTGLTGLLAFFGMLWSSYRLGYTHGQQSYSSPAMTLHSSSGGSPSSPSALNTSNSLVPSLRAHTPMLALPAPSR